MTKTTIGNLAIPDFLFKVPILTNWLHISEHFVEKGTNCCAMSIEYSVRLLYNYVMLPRTKARITTNSKAVKRDDERERHYAADAVGENLPSADYLDGVFPVSSEDYLCR